MTHGERYMIIKESLDFKSSLENILRRYGAMPKRMSRRDAAAYYSAKIRDYFMKNYFDKPEDYFGFFEAKKMRKALI